MKRSRYHEYISRFSAEDPPAFDEFLTTDMKMLNGALEFEGVAGTRYHYENKIWPFFHERLNILRYVSDDAYLAIQIWTNFEAKGAGDTLFGAIEKGEKFDYRGIITMAAPLR